MSSIRQRRLPDEPNAAQRAATDQPASRKRPRYSDTLLVAAAPILLTLQVFVVRAARVRMQLTPRTSLQLTDQLLVAGSVQCTQNLQHASSHPSQCAIRCLF